MPVCTATYITDFRILPFVSSIFSSFTLFYKKLWLHLLLLLHVAVLTDTCTHTLQFNFNTVCYTARNAGYVRSEGNSRIQVTNKNYLRSVWWGSSACSITWPPAGQLKRGGPIPERESEFCPPGTRLKNVAALLQDSRNRKVKLTACLHLALRSKLIVQGLN